jgi:hypothetical protein
MTCFFRPQRSGTKIELVPNSSPSTDGKLLDTNPSGGAISDVTSTMDTFISSSDVATEEEVTYPINQDRVKTVAWKGKENPPQ